LYNLGLPAGTYHKNMAINLNYFWLIWDHFSHENSFEYASKSYFSGQNLAKIRQ
jgi:hypothetical protein